MRQVIYPNLESELSRIGLSKVALARIINISVTSIYSKFNGKSEFNLGEMKNISHCLETMTDKELTLDYLFERN